MILAPVLEQCARHSVQRARAVGRSDHAFAARHGSERVVPQLDGHGACQQPATPEPAGHAFRLPQEFRQQFVPVFDRGVEGLFTADGLVRPLADHFAVVFPARQ